MVSLKEELLELLKKNRKGLPGFLIRKELNRDRDVIRRALNKLADQGKVYSQSFGNTNHLTFWYYKD